MSDQNQHLKDDQLQAYLDGALDPSTTETVRTHLDACPACNEQFAQLNKLNAHLEGIPEIPLQRDLSQLVIEELKGEQSLSPAITWTLVIEALAAGIAISLLIPALQAAGWLPRLQNIRLAFQTAASIYFTQLASSWMVWWAELKLQLSLLVREFNPLDIILLEQLSPWTLISVAGGLLVLINALLLRGQPRSKHNHNHLHL
jgi:hypothetical protein